jgi:hypothetical protein
MLFPDYTMLKNYIKEFFYIFLQEDIYITNRTTLSFREIKITH